MKIVKKNNRVLRIADDRLERYLKAGYCEIDNTGKVLTAAADPETARKAEIAELRKKNRELTKENKALREAGDAMSAELAALKAGGQS